MHKQIQISANVSVAKDFYITLLVAQLKLERTIL